MHWKSFSNTYITRVLNNVLEVLQLNSMQGTLRTALTQDIMGRFMDSITIGKLACKETVRKTLLYWRDEAVFLQTDKTPWLQYSENILRAPLFSYRQLALAIFSETEASGLIVMRFII